MQAVGDAECRQPAQAARQFKVAVAAGLQSDRQPLHKKDLPVGEQDDRLVDLEQAAKCVDHDPLILGDAPTRVNPVGAA
jgi:hypothetical protein